MSFVENNLKMMNYNKIKLILIEMSEIDLVGWLDGWLVGWVRLARLGETGEELPTVGLLAFLCVLSSSGVIKMSEINLNSEK